MRTCHRTQSTGVWLNVTEPRSLAMSICHRTQNTGVWSNMTKPRLPEVSIYHKTQSTGVGLNVTKPTSSVLSGCLETEHWSWVKIVNPGHRR